MNRAGVAESESALESGFGITSALSGSRVPPPARTCQRFRGEQIGPHPSYPLPCSLATGLLLDPTFQQTAKRLSNDRNAFRVLFKITSD